MNNQIKERGIIFNGEMVKAILDGRKTQTRRIVKVQPEYDQLGLRFITDSSNPSEIGKYVWTESNATGHIQRSKSFKCPFGQVGDRLYVRETCQAVEHDSGLDVVRYPADGNEIPVKAHPLDAGRWVDLYRYRGGKGKAAPSVHMPRWASRITLEITDIRVERLREINECGARAEGCKDKKPWTGLDGLIGSGGYTAREKFEELWESIYGQDSWQSNPFVWVVEFKRVCQ